MSRAGDENEKTNDESEKTIAEMIRKLKSVIKSMKLAAEGTSVLSKIVIEDPVYSGSGESGSGSGYLKPGKDDDDEDNEDNDGDVTFTKGITDQPLVDEPRENDNANRPKITVSKTTEVETMATGHGGATSLQTSVFLVTISQLAQLIN